MKLDNQYAIKDIPLIICKCFVFCSLSLIIIVIKLAGIKANAIDRKKHRFVEFLILF